ncbi:hypothetical protein PR048_012630 [Dryococelus australis]|uniref:Uncharacterized protein n=1 Tax=Dryococelus australis TaxID=614101 RepID=A0ABQ9HQN3_9NEOP|nr:hypothetical protein PR048_012630 [Dryococelus australis]
MKSGSPAPRVAEASHAPARLAPPTRTAPRLHGRQSLPRHGHSLSLGMYSLYRAWLMQDAVLSTPPDVILHVGAASRAAQQFAAHRAVVAAHSGYLKALLPTTVAAETVAVSVPNISPDVFASLLTFMYTGYMDVTHENIYAVLLATHLLHMPRALDLCRSFLMQNQNTHDHGSYGTVTLPTLVKPIPSRKMLPLLFDLGGLPHSTNPYWLQQPPPPPPSTRLGTQFLLPTVNNSPFRTVTQGTNVTAPGAITGCHDAKTDGKNETSTVDDCGKRLMEFPLSTPSTSAICHFPSPGSPTTQSLSPCLPPTLLQNCNVFRKETNRSDNEKSSKKETDNKGNSRVQGKGDYTPINHSIHTTTAVSNGSKVIIDIACCDGPVRFHRVLNDNYGLTLDELLPGKLKNFLEINDKIKHTENKQQCPEKQQMKMLKTMNKSNMLVNEGNTSSSVTNDESRKHQSGCNIETKVAVILQPTPTSSTGYLSKKLSSFANNEQTTLTKGSNHSTGTNNSGIDTVYTCLYCNHAFKSHYCYQKHARRHINPVTIDLKCITDRLDGPSKNFPINDISSPEKPQTNSSLTINGKTKDKGRPEVRLLDMNVQYYPCKTCGSKFPSYYFVHKHRKMCHANEETDSVFSSDDAHSLKQLQCK